MKAPIIASRESTVIVTIRGGVAERHYVPPSVRLVIVDFDLTENGACPVCGEPALGLSASDALACGNCGWTEAFGLERQIKWMP